MKPWQRSYDVEQMAVELPEVAGVSTRRLTLAACNALAPDSGLRICLRLLSGGQNYCQRLYGHPGGHSKKPTTCNRPAGHEGPHAFIVSRDASKLGEW